MNCLKFYIFLIALGNFHIAFSQGVKEYIIINNCQSSNDSLYQNYTLNGKSIRYLVLSVGKPDLNVQNEYHIGEGSVLLLFLSQLNVDEQKLIANWLMTNYKLSQITLFESCASKELFYRALVHTEEEKKRLKKEVAHFYWQDL